MSEHRVSAIVTALQLERFISDAIRSIQAQTRPVDEIVVIDNGSTDSTRDIVKDFAGGDARIRLVDESARGAATARNTGIGAATGDVIAFLDGDDLWPESKIDRQMARLESPPRVDVVTGPTTFVDMIDPETLLPSANARTETMQQSNLGACLYRRAVFERVGLFDADLRYTDDLDLMLRIRDAGFKVAAVPEAALFYRRHPESLIAQPDPRKAQEMASVIGRSLMRRRKLGLPPPLPFREELMA